MNSNSRELIIGEFKKLRSYEKEAILTKLFSLSNYNKDKNGVDVSCPFCGSLHFWKNGKLKYRQRYLCKKCGKSFNIFTNTPLSYSKKDISVWLDYYDELLNQTSLRKCARKLDISLSTAFFWRHKIIDAIRENKPNLKLKDKIQLSEVYFRESFKGNHSKSGFKMPRSSYKNKFSWLYDGIGMPSNVCVMNASDSSDFTLTTACCIGNPSAEDLIRIYKHTIKEKSTVITKPADYYKKFASSLLLNQIELSFGSNRNVSIIENAALMPVDMKYFISIYRGVASKYLQNYLDLFTFIRNPFVDYPLLLRNKNSFKNTKFKGRPPMYS